jgi:O-6-methylguanine DNA methyltransferase
MSTMPARRPAARATAADAFARRVLRVVSRIPPGRVCTYGDVAALAGAPGAARAAGNVLARATVPGLPYHRVIAAGGRLGGYGQPQLKRALHAAEGLEVARGGVRRFDDVRWPGGRRRAPINPAGARPV